MAKIAVFALLMFVLAANAEAGRKMLQHYKSSGGRGAEVAALTGTTANINKAVAEHKKPTASNPGDKLAVTPKIATGASTKVAATATPTTAIAAGPKTDKGGAAEGAPQVGMTAAAVAINKHASGTPPPKHTAPTTAGLTNAISGAPKGFGTSTAGSAATNMQAATGAAINTAVDKASKGADRP